MPKLPKKYKPYLPYLQSLKDKQTYINFADFIGVKNPIVKIFNKEFKIPKGIISKCDLEEYIWEDSIKTSSEFVYLDVPFEKFDLLQIFKITYEELGESLSLVYLYDEKTILTFAFLDCVRFSITKKMYGEAIKLKPEIDKYFKV
jgi:hypothetical protein